MSDAPDDPLSAHFERLLGDAVTPAVVRQVEAGGATAALWARFEDSGFLDAMVPEGLGGAGQTLAAATPLLLALGRQAVPLPLAQTLFLRGVLAQQGRAAPHGALALADRVRLADDGAIFCPGVPFGMVSDHVAVALPSGACLLPVAAAERTATGVHGSLRADLRWPARPRDALACDATPPWAEAGAALSAALLAGGMERVLQMTLDFANQREQFGRSIGRFQAVQHQLAVMAEQVAAARMAAELGCAGTGLWPHPLRAALAKARTSEAAAQVAAIAHAVHGAIGVTAEFDLQQHTRRLHESRADFGAEGHWQRVLGRALLASPDATLPFMLSALIPENA
jgi:alkylation response protein AidB-like acyl-CoA dehydrogenase